MGCSSPSTISLAIAPDSATVGVGQTQSFAVSVAGTSRTAVSWAVTEADGGTIDDNGLYTAPPAPGSFHVVATLVDAKKSATATVTVTPGPQLVVSVVPQVVDLRVGDSQIFSAVLENTPDQKVTWSVMEAAGGTIDSRGLYTAPAAAGTFHVLATSAADPTKVGSATIHVHLVSIAITPAVATLGIGQTQSFAAEVSGGSDPTVHFSVLESGGGTVTDAGLYTAPSTAGTFHVVATSLADSTATGSAEITVTTTPQLSVTVSPANAGPLAEGSTQDFAASVENGSGGVSWSMLEPAGGSIDSSGHYAAPFHSGTFHVVATSLSDPTKKGIGSVTIARATLTLDTTAIALDQEAAHDFVATLGNTTSTLVRWSVLEPNGGTIDQSGHYQAPSHAGVFHVIATGADDPVSATATVTVHEVSITLNAPTSFLDHGATFSFIVTLTGSADGDVNWRSSCGVLSTLVSAGSEPVLFTAPSNGSATQCTVTASSAADPSQSASVVVDLNPIRLELNAPPGPIDHASSFIFVASLFGTVDDRVFWSTTCGQLASPSTNASGASNPFTAPSLAAISSCKVTATSGADDTESTTITVNLNPIRFVITPSSVTVPLGSSQAFTVKESGTAAPVITWQISGNAGGNLGSSGWSVNGSYIWYTPGTTGQETIMASDANSMSGTSATAYVIASDTISVSGNVAFDPSVSAVSNSIYVVLNDGRNPVCGTHVFGPGPFTMRCAPPSNGTQLSLEAWEDALSVGTYSYALDAYGTIAPFTYAGGNLNGFNLTLFQSTAPSPSAAPALNGATSVAGPSSALVVAFFEPVRDNQGRNLADHYRAYLSTSPSPGPGNHVAVITERATDEPVLLFPATVGSSYYIAVSAIRSGVEGPLSAPRAVTVAPPASGGFTVSGFLYLNGIQPTGPLVILCGQTPVTVIAHPPKDPIPYSFNLPDGTSCTVTAVLDQNDDGIIGPLDIIDDNGPTITVSGGPVSAPQFEVPPDGSLAVAKLGRHQSADGTDHWTLNIGAQGNTRLPVAASLELARPIGATLPIDLPNPARYNSSRVRFAPGSIPLPIAPASYDLYMVNVTYADWSIDSDFTTAPVFPSTLPTLVSPAPSASGVGLIGTFSWTLPPELTNASELIRVNLATGESVWVSSALPAGTTSTPYLGPALSPGTNYVWTVECNGQNYSSARDAAFTD
jgi:hypothetical protein